MSAQHTREPWKYGKELTARSGEWLISMDAGDRGRGIAIAETRPASGDEQSNAARIVACVNACAGTTTADLKRIAYFGGWEKVSTVWKDDREQLEQQRDELQRRLDAIDAQKPAAYMHNDGITVISNPVRDLWRGADPRRVENYTIPLFAKAQGAV
jgi:hypothetical protein